jgi:hypothetical protein
MSKQICKRKTLTIEVETALPNKVFTKKQVSVVLLLESGEIYEIHPVQVQVNAIKMKG